MPITIQLWTFIGFIQESEGGEIPWLEYNSNNMHNAFFYFFWIKQFCKMHGGPSMKYFKKFHSFCETVSHMPNPYPGGQGLSLVWVKLFNMDDPTRCLCQHYVFTWSGHSHLPVTLRLCPKGRTGLPCKHAILYGFQKCWELKEYWPKETTWQIFYQK